MKAPDFESAALFFLRSHISARPTTILGGIVMNKSAPRHENSGYGIPPEIYDVGVGWDPQPEINRLLFLLRQIGLEPRSALELGCATGRLLLPLRESVPEVFGIELSPTMAALARRRGLDNIVGGDMTDFALDRRFDLIFTSANTIRHALTDDAIRRMWNCIHDHLTPGGVFIADLELGLQYEIDRVGQPTSWEISRGNKLVKVTWLVTEPPSPDDYCCMITYTFKSRGEEPRGTWQESFKLRAYDASEFVRMATAEGLLNLLGLYEVRDPYLPETSPDKASGRHLVLLQRPR